ncbi:MAG: hypothetical protein M0R75_16805, partial [Dehalococcoidia bacterium]|nr:hypothetical protein [Dehalococcoidia bacterium]
QLVERPTRNGEAAGSSPALSSTLAHLAACGADCWGDQLTRAEVEALALSVTGDAAWSAWAAGCFTGGGENRGYVGAVGGPNWDGSYDVGLPQINTVHATWADLTRALGDPAYAVETAYALWQVQGYAAWRGC